MIEQVLDKIDEWSYKIHDWERTSPSREAIVFCLYGVLTILVAFIFLGFIMALFIPFLWALGTLFNV